MGKSESYNIKKIFLTASGYLIADNSKLCSYNNESVVDKSQEPLTIVVHR